MKVINYKKRWPFVEKGTRDYIISLWNQQNMYIMFSGQFSELQEKEFLTTEEFSKAPEVLRLLARRIADYIRYDLDIREELILDYDSDVEEIFIKIKPKFSRSLEEKIRLEEKIVKKVFEKFPDEETWNINIMVE